MLPKAFDRCMDQLTERASGKRRQPFRRHEHLSAIWASLTTYDLGASEFVTTVPADKPSCDVLPQYDFGGRANERFSPVD